MFIVLEPLASVKLDPYSVEPVNGPFGDYWLVQGRTVQRATPRLHLLDLEHYLLTHSTASQEIGLLLLAAQDSDPLLCWVHPEIQQSKLDLYQFVQRYFIAAVAFRDRPSADDYALWLNQQLTWRLLTDNSQKSII